MLNSWKIITQTSLARIYVLLIALAFLAVTARWLGPHGRGQLAAVLTWMTAFSTIGHFSMGQVAVYKAANADDKTFWLKQALGALTFWAGTASLVMVAVVLVLYSITGGLLFGDIPGVFLALGLILLPLKIWDSYGASLLMSLERLNDFNRFQVIAHTTGFIFLMILMVAGYGVGGAIVATGTGLFIFAGGSYFVLLRRAKSLRLFDWSANTGYLKAGLKLHLNAIGAYLYVATDILMLNYYRGSEETGYYQLGVQLMTAIMVLPYATSMVMYGQVSSQGPNQAWIYQRKLLWQITFIMIVIGLLAGITAKWWLVWFAGAAFFPTVGLFHWQLLSVVGMTFSILMAPQWIGRGYFWQASLLTVFVGLGNVVLNAILIPEYGMYGAIWASLAVYIFSIFGNGTMMIHCNKKAAIGIAGGRKKTDE